MKLTKENVCVFIENEAQLEEARQMLEKYGEKVAEDGTFSLSDDNEQNYLNLFIDDEWYLGENQTFLNEIAIEQLEEILKFEESTKSTRQQLEEILKESNV